jgi:histidinol phosphatase-like enzyme
MLLQASADHGIDLSRSYMIGDTERDAEAARRAGCHAIMLGSSKGIIEKRRQLWAGAVRALTDAETAAR